MMYLLIKDACLLQFYIIYIIKNRSKYLLEERGSDYESYANTKTSIK